MKRGWAHEGLREEEERVLGEQQLAYALGMDRSSQWERLGMTFFGAGECQDL